MANLTPAQQARHDDLLLDVQTKLPVLAAAEQYGSKKAFAMFLGELLAAVKELNAFRRQAGLPEIELPHM